MGIGPLIAVDTIRRACSGCASPPTATALRSQHPAARASDGKRPVGGRGGSVR